MSRVTLVGQTFPFQFIAEIYFFIVCSVSLRKTDDGNHITLAALYLPLTISSFLYDANITLALLSFALRSTNSKPAKNVNKIEPDAKDNTGNMTSNQTSLVRLPATSDGSLQ